MGSARELSSEVDCLLVIRSGICVRDIQSLPNNVSDVVIAVYTNSVVMAISGHIGCTITGCLMEKKLAFPITFWVQPRILHDKWCPKVFLMMGSSTCCCMRGYETRTPHYLVNDEALR